MKKTAFASLPLLVIFLAAIFAVEGCRSRTASADYTEHHADRIAEMISDKLDLTQPQKATLENIKRDLLAKKDLVRGIRSGLARELAEEIKSESFNEDRINKSLEQREASFKELRALAVAKMGEFHAVLTPEQRTKLAENLSKYSR